MNFLSLLVLAVGVCRTEAAVPMMRLEIEPVWDGTPLKVSGAAEGRESSRLSRLDYLLSKLALKKADGAWVESRDWFAFFSLEKGQLRAEADGLPAESFTAIRFQVGVPPEINQADPAIWPVGHALNPQVCGLHWGWQGGMSSWL